MADSVSLEGQTAGMNNEDESSAIVDISKPKFSAHVGQQVKTRRAGSMGAKKLENYAVLGLASKKAIKNFE